MSNTQVAGVMKELKIGSQESVKVMGLLANKTELVREKQELAARAMREGVSLTDEFNIKNNNLAGNLEKIQKKLMGAFVNSKIMQGLENLVNKTAKYLEIPLSEKLETERLELIKTKNRLFDVNLQQGDRLKLINQLVKSYPDYFAGIEAEKMSNQELAKTIKAINDQLINKIILQREDEKIAEQNERVAERKMDALHAEAKMQETIAKVMMDNQELLDTRRFEFDDEKSQLENFKDLFVFLQKQREEAIRSRRDYSEVALSDLRAIQGVISDFEDAQRALNEAEGEATGMLEARQKLMEQLNKQSGQDEIQRRKDLAEWSKVAEERLKALNPDEEETEPETDIGAGTGLTEEERKKLEAQQKKVLAAYQKLQDELKKEKESDHQEGLEEAARMGEERAALQEEIFKSELEERQLELYNIRKHYDDLIAEAERLQLSEEEIDTLRLQKKEALQQAEAQLELEREALRELIRQEGLSKQEQELQQIEQHYDNLIAQAERLMLEEVEIEKLKHLKLKALRDASNKEREMSTEEALRAQERLFSAFSDMLGNIMQLSAERGSADLEFQRGLTLAQIAIDTASAISSVTSNNAKTSLTPIDLAIRTASAIAMVLGNIARAKAVLEQADTPQAPSYFFGGDTGNKGFFRDRYGDVAGLVHTNEYVIPRVLRQDPEVADFERIIEAKRTNRQFNLGGRTSEKEPVNMPTKDDDNELLKEFRELKEGMQNWRSNMRAYIVWDDLEDTQEDVDFIREQSSI
jgi:hypothetical protein